MKKQICKRDEFNIRLNEEDRKIIDELFANNINISGMFKMAIRNYLEKIKKLNQEIKND